MLLHSLLKESDGEAKEPNKESKAKASTELKRIGTLKGKRKDLSFAMRHMIEQEQSNVVEMYRQLKKSQRAENADKK